MAFEISKVYGIVHKALDYRSLRQDLIAFLKMSQTKLCLWHRLIQGIYRPLIIARIALRFIGVMGIWREMMAIAWI